MKQLLEIGISCPGNRYNATFLQKPKLFCVLGLTLTTERDHSIHQKLDEIKFSLIKFS